MRIMLDTNVLLSALLFPSPRMDAMLWQISARHTLVLSSFVVEELKEVVLRKFPTKTLVVDALLAKMSFELVYTPQQMEQKLFAIRDNKDYPVLYPKFTRWTSRCWRWPASRFPSTTNQN